MIGCRAFPGVGPGNLILLRLGPQAGFHSMVDELEEELVDRFGPIPPEGEELLKVVRTKERLRLLGIKRLEVQNGYAVIQFAAPERLDLARLMALLKKRPEKFRLTPDQTLRLKLPAEGSPWISLENCLKEVETFVKGV